MNKKFIFLGLINTLVLAGVVCYLSPREEAAPSAPASPTELSLPQGQGDWTVTSLLPINLPDAKYLAVAGDSYYVASTGCIHHYDAQATLLEVIPNTTQKNITAIAYLQGMLAIAKQGLLSMGDIDLDLGAKAYITDMALKEGKLYLADAGQRKVQIFNLQGEKLGEITGYEDESFKIPSPYFSLCAGEDGELWVSDPARLLLVHFDAQDVYMAQWQGQGDAAFLGCCNPARLRCLSQGRFLSLEKGQVRARVFSPSGLVESIVAQGSDFPLNKSFCYDLALINDNHIAILDGHIQQIRFYQQTPTP